MEKIKKEHELNKAIVDRFKILYGTKMTIESNGQTKEVTIDWINPYYFWFGSKDRWVLPKEIITIDGQEVKEKIEKMKAKIFEEKELKK
jgi:hypothetical protein